jgi:hypothetical protein
MFPPLKVHVIDSHRPWHPANVHADGQVRFSVEVQNTMQTEQFPVLPRLFFLVMTNMWGTFLLTTRIFFMTMAKLKAKSWAASTAALLTARLLLGRCTN